VATLLCNASRRCRLNVAEKRELQSITGKIKNKNNQPGGRFCCLQAAQRHKERKEKINLAAAAIHCRTQCSNTQAAPWHNERKRSKYANCEAAQEKNNNNQIGSGWWRCINNQPGSSGAVSQSTWRQWLLSRASYAAAQGEKT